MVDVLAPLGCGLSSGARSGAKSHNKCGTKLLQSEAAGGI